jgi:choline-sulfatase
MLHIVEFRSLFALALAISVAGVSCSKCGPPSEGPRDAQRVHATTDDVAEPRPDASPDAAGPTALGSGRFNVLLITIDSLRADMPWAGYARPIAPRLSAVYARSTAYTHAYSTSSFTSKSIPGILTGRYPSELARTGSFFTKYMTAEQFVCKHLRDQSIPCIGGHAHKYFGAGQSGFETGFVDWRIVPGITFDYQTDPYVTSDKLTPLAIEMLDAVTTDAGTTQPFLAWFHYMDPHDEYKSHAESPHFGKRARDLYDEEVFFADLWIGKLLDFVEAQPWAKKTVIVVSADHGEAFGEHGITRHAHEVWEELVHVPLFFLVPGGRPREIETTRGHADLMPTFVELLGGADIPPLQGKSLVHELSDPTAMLEERDVVVDLPEDDYNDRRRALIHGTTKLIAFGDDARFALFDLAADPHEAEDLIVKRPELANEMRTRYREAKKTIVDVPPRGGIPGRDKPEGRSTK